MKRFLRVLTAVSAYGCVYGVLAVMWGALLLNLQLHSLVAVVATMMVVAVLVLSTAVIHMATRAALSDA